MDIDKSLTDLFGENSILTEICILVDSISEELNSTIGNYFASLEEDSGSYGEATII